MHPLSCLGMSPIISRNRFIICCDSAHVGVTEDFILSLFLTAFPLLFLSFGARLENWQNKALFQKDSTRGLGRFC